MRPACTHEDFHAIRTSYDHERGLLLFNWSCERCGAVLSEARREQYRPSFDPRGNDPFLGPRSLPG